jgi:mRNA interferase MazF
MSCKPGRLVGIPFPYTDLSTKKRRPVLVVTHPDRNGDFMGLAVTSVPTSESAIAIDEESMATGRLPKPSWIRYDKIFTLTGSMVISWYGDLNPGAFRQVMERLCVYLGCFGLSPK